jgi:hypothetical protein
MQKYVNGELIDMSPAEITAFQDGQAVDPVAELANERAQMTCSKMQGILTLGETKWGDVLAYRDLATTTWAEKMIIDSATDWHAPARASSLSATLLAIQMNRWMPCSSRLPRL